MKRAIAMILAAATILLLFSACGKQEIQLQLTDAGETKTISAFTGMTVEEALAAAQITLHEKDAVTPAREEKIKKDTTAITIERYAKVTILYDDKQQAVELVGGTVADALSQAKITLAKDDEINMDKNAVLKDGDTIKIAKAVTIKVTADGETKTYKTTKKTVGEALKAIGIQTDDDDNVTPDKKKGVKDGMEITVVRVEVKEETKEESIAYKTKKVSSSKMEKGTSKVTQQGANGKKSVTYLCTYKDGKLVNKEKKSEKVLVNAKTKIVTYGTKAKAKTNQTSGKTLISIEDVPNCNGDGHGYYVYKYSDGSVKNVDY